MGISQATKSALLRYACLVVGIFGIGYVFAALPSADILPRFVIDLVFWPLDSAQDFSAPEHRVMVCTVGAVMMLLSYIINTLIVQLPEAQQPTVERIILVGLTGWFLVEAVFSLIVGVPYNLLLNAAFAGMFIIPILLPTTRASS